MRELLTRAVTAPRDPAWTADGNVSKVWLPISQVTGRLDSFQWRVPVEGSLPELSGEFLIAEADEPGESGQAPALELAPIPPPQPGSDEASAEPVTDGSPDTDDAAPPPAPSAEPIIETASRAAADEDGDGPLVPPQPDDPGVPEDEAEDQAEPDPVLAANNDESEGPR